MSDQTPPPGIPAPPGAQQFMVPPGLCVVTTHGSVRVQTVSSLLNMQRFMVERGVQNVAFDFRPGALVDKARNDACGQMLSMKEAQYLLFLDADMVWAPDLLMRLLQTAYHTHPFLDVVGGYAQLRGGPALPTIDTGTGTWESHYPGSGVLEVMRTGGACLLIKRHVIERLPKPWFALRVPMRPIDAMYEVDAFARTKFDGANPFMGGDEKFWERLFQCAVEDPSTPAMQAYYPAEVGEDSGFSDRVRAHGFRIGVDTHAVLGHVTDEVQDWTKHKKFMDDNDRQHQLAVGLIP